MKDAPTYAGIDVSKERLDVVIRPSGEYLRMGNDEKGIGSLVSRLREGRAGVRTTLYMATLSATRCNSKMVALTACMRKLLMVLAAVLRNRTPRATREVRPL